MWMSWRICQGADELWHCWVCLGGIAVCCKHQIVFWDDLLLEGQLQFGVMSVFTNYGQTIIVFRYCQELTFVEDDFHTVIRQFVEIIKSHVESGWNMSSQGFDDNSCQGGIFWWLHSGGQAIERMWETITCLWNKCSWFLLNSNISSGVSLCELLSSDTQMSFHWVKGMINSLTQFHEKDKHWRTLPSLLFSFFSSYSHESNNRMTFTDSLLFFISSHTLIFIISFLLIFWFWPFLCHSFRQMTLRNHKYTQDIIIHSMSFILVSNEKPVSFDKNGQYDTFLCSESTKKHRVFLSFLCLCVCVLK